MTEPVNTAGVSSTSDPRVTIVAVPASGNAPVLISASGFDGYVEIQECPPGGSGEYTGGAFVGQGLELTRADENYANTYPLVPGAIWAIGDTFMKHRSVGVPPMGMADGSTRPGTPFVELVSATATATQVEVREWRQR